MANTNTSTYIQKCPKTVTLYFTMLSDGTNETATVIYDSSALATDMGITDTLDCTIQQVYAYTSVAATARVKLLFDATTDVLALNIPPGNMSIEKDFRDLGGLPNYAGTGKTGDILLTTTGLASGDSMVIIINLRVD